MKKFIKRASLLGLGIALLGTIVAFTSPFALAKEGCGYKGHGHGKMDALLELPADKQTLVLSTMKQVKEQNKALKEEIKTTKEALTAALTAPEFDEKAYTENANKLQALMNQKFATMTDAVRSIAPEFTQQEREILAKMLPKGPKGPRGGCR